MNDAIDVTQAIRPLVPHPKGLCAPIPHLPRASAPGLDCFASSGGCISREEDALRCPLAFGNKEFHSKKVIVKPKTSVAEGGPLIAEYRRHKCLLHPVMAYSDGETGLDWFDCLGGCVRREVRRCAQHDRKLRLGHVLFVIDSPRKNAVGYASPQGWMTLIFENLAFSNRTEASRPICAARR